MSSSILLALVAGCTADKADDLPGGIPILSADSASTESNTDSVGSGDSPTVVEEICDGVDNNLDGQVDEGSPDIDVDGVADCLDRTCDVVDTPSTTLSETTACSTTLTPPSDPWSWELLWEYDPVHSCRVSAAADLDGNGTRDVLCAELHDIVALDGATGATLWSYSEVDNDSPLAVADLTGDGVVEVIALHDTRRILVLSSAGTPRWVSPGVFERGRLVADVSLRVADLDADGVPEVLNNNVVMSLETGFLVAGLDTWDDLDSYLVETEVADLDRDGQLEICTRGSCWDSEGRLLFESLDLNPETDTVTGVVIQADTDDDAEVGWVNAQRLRVVDTDGSTLTDLQLEEAPDRGFPCAADIDGDGLSEIFTWDLIHFAAFSASGDSLWSLSLGERTPIVAGCTTFDFDQDGVREIVTQGSGPAMILDAQGTVLWEDEYQAGTLGATPMVIDTDGDGSVEIIVPPGRAGMSVRVFTNTAADLAPGTPFWSHSGWSGEALQSDGSVPRTPHQPWLTDHAWRYQPESWIPGSDIRPEVVSSCVASCEAGEVRLAVAVSNLGPDERRVDTPVAVYQRDTSGGRALVEVLQFGPWLDDSVRSTSQEVVLSLEAARLGVELVAGDDGSGTLVVDDCDTANNVLDWALDVCP